LESKLGSYCYIAKSCRSMKISTGVSPKILTNERGMDLAPSLDSFLQVFHSAFAENGSDTVIQSVITECREQLEYDKLAGEDEIHPVLSFKEEGRVSKKIKDNLWQVGGGRLTDPGDAAAYLVRFGDKAALIDAGCGNGHSRLMQNIEGCLAPNGQLEYLLLTHCHFDHTGGAEALRKEFGCRIVAHELDAVYLESGDPDVTAASWYGSLLNPFTVDLKLQGDEHNLKVGEGSVKAIHWPGHSPGSVVYTTVIEGELVLFGQDVHGPIHPSLLSDERQYQVSLAKLAALDADLLLEGHFGIFRTKHEVREFIESFMK
jgi:glyoxylase-like metal-dependent hydrolase (beta-lactamase superfamily II)